MQRTPTIARCPTPEQVDYFKRACGTARRIWNWARRAWNRHDAAGGRPNTMARNKPFTAITDTDPQWLDESGWPWVHDMHQDAHTQPFRNRANAWERFVADRREGNEAHEPRLKHTGRCRESLDVVNDTFPLMGTPIRLPRIGDVAMTEDHLVAGTMVGATVSCPADRWCVAIPVDVPDAPCSQRRTAHEVNGLDLGSKAAATIASGDVVAVKKAAHRSAASAQNPSPTSQPHALKPPFPAAGCERRARLPTGTRLPVSNNWRTSARRWARLHARRAHLRADGTHTRTTRLCREHQAFVIADGTVKGMLANERLARAIADVGVGMVRSLSAPTTTLVTVSSTTT
jgi:putative transposase